MTQPRKVQAQKNDETSATCEFDPQPILVLAHADLNRPTTRAGMDGKRRPQTSTNGEMHFGMNFIENAETKGVGIWRRTRLRSCSDLWSG
jgi:hypothetical protein